MVSVKRTWPICAIFNEPETGDRPTNPVEPPNVANFDYLREFARLCSRRKTRKTWKNTWFFVISAVSARSLTSRQPQNWLSERCRMRYRIYPPSGIHLTTARDLSAKYSRVWDLIGDRLLTPLPLQKNTHGWKTQMVATCGQRNHRQDFIVAPNAARILAVVIYHHSSASLLPNVTRAGKVDCPWVKYCKPSSVAADPMMGVIVCGTTSCNLVPIAFTTRQYAKRKPEE